MIFLAAGKCGVWRRAGGQAGSSAPPRQGHQTRPDPPPPQDHPTPPSGTLLRNPYTPSDSTQCPLSARRYSRSLRPSSPLSLISSLTVAATLPTSTTCGSAAQLNKGISNPSSDFYLTPTSSTLCLAVSGTMSQLLSRGMSSKCLARCTCCSTSPWPSGRDTVWTVHSSRIQGSRYLPMVMSRARSSRLLRVGGGGRT